MKLSLILEAAYEHSKLPTAARFLRVHDDAAGWHVTKAVIGDRQAALEIEYGAATSDPS